MIRFAALIKIYYLLPLDPSPSICARKGLVYSPSLWFKLTRRLAPNPPPRLNFPPGRAFCPQFYIFPRFESLGKPGLSSAPPPNLLFYQLSVPAG